MSKVGRNDPCPCGSGLKYKRCCGSSITNENYIKPDIDSFSLYKDIAYKGNIGKQRRKFCIQYIDSKKRAQNTIKEKISADLAKKGKNITCAMGCCYCCANYVETTIQECEAIVYYLYTHEDVYNMFLKKYPEWRNNIKVHGDLFKNCANSENPILENNNSESVKYFNQNIYCPFLENQLCTIYEVRPNSCAGLVSLSSPDKCRSDNPEQPELIRMLTPNWSMYTSFYFNKLNGPVTAFMPIAVYEILKYGTFYYSKANILGLERLDMEFCHDKEVLSILKERGVLLKPIDD
jgi:hypothetical protein